ncbi:MAG: biotin--[acetyl-CoA-carboxylase] ligase [Dehalococcoidia bacterium]|nr:biotin--[acetyl-CoA-carboxylase] ligase [Dehalococcoidia bacterium]
MPRFDTAAFHQRLATAAIGRALEYRSVVETTMTVAAGLARSGACHGMLVLAEQQTAGRGRRGRTFHSPPEGNLYFTLILRTAPETHRRLPVALPLAVAAACRAEGCDALIKWPNDIWAKGRKLCGMLIDAESAVGEGTALALAGIGVNVNGDPGTVPELRDIATSLSRELARPVSRERLLARICLEIENALAAAGEDLLAAYRKLSLVLGRDVLLSYPDGEARTACAEAIDSDGALLVRYPDGTRETVTAADVTLRPAGG